MASIALHEASTAAAVVVDQVRDAFASSEPLRIAGGATWLDAGRPVSNAPVLSTRSLSGIVDYVPGDLTLTALAGTTLRTIAELTAPNNQWLPLDPFGSMDGTLGATVATGSSGPLAHANGGPRDLVLGIECVTGAGEVVRGGGRVAKNVAGFDLTRLLVGSWGTLGVLTEVSVRLRGRPAVETTIMMRMPSEPGELAARLERVRLAPLEAMAMELVNAPLAAALGLNAFTTLIVRLGGNADSVRAQRTTLARIGEIADAPQECWARLRTIEPPDAWVWRMSDLPSRVGRTWASAAGIVHGTQPAWMHASVGRGVVRCISSSAANSDAAGGEVRGTTRPPLIDALLRSAFGGTIIHERLPADAWPLLTTPAADDVVSRRIRASFDPRSILNRGILGEVSRER